MRIVVEPKRCEGHGVCAATAPNLFELSDNGELTLTYDGIDIPPTEIIDAESAVSCCPVQALRLTTDDPS
jgi:ferredoxin